MTLLLERRVVVVQNTDGRPEHKIGQASTGSGKIRRDITFDCREPMSISLVEPVTKRTLVKQFL